jgi:hypothetical protein
MAFKRWKKSPSKRPPRKLWSKDEMKVIGWCLQNKIGVGISPDWNDDLQRWQIEININGKVHTDPNRYNGNVLDKMYEYYKYYYDKHNK